VVIGTNSPKEASVPFDKADTHAVFSYFIASLLLGAQARAAFDEGKPGQALIYIPAIVLAELFFLNQKKQRPIDFAATFALLTQSAQFVLLPFEPIDTLQVERDRGVPDIHDRTSSASPAE
jgi:predicted nucleic acid-binding protein